ncbi:hypothetical protein MRX96_031823 [Rhipicephalus microplus]
MAGAASPSRNATSTLRKSSNLRHPPRMLSAEEAPAPGNAREATLNPGATVPPGYVPARAPGRQNRTEEVPLLSFAAPQGRGTFRRGRPRPAPARPPPFTARSRRSMGPIKPGRTCLLEATNRISPRERAR